MYFFNAIDRTNVGNAKTDGITKTCISKAMSTRCSSCSSTFHSERSIRHSTYSPKRFQRSGLFQLWWRSGEALLCFNALPKTSLAFLCFVFFLELVKLDSSPQWCFPSLSSTRVESWASVSQYSSVLLSSPLLSAAWSLSRFFQINDPHVKAGCGSWSSKDVSLSSSVSWLSSGSLLHPQLHGFSTQMRRLPLEHEASETPLTKSMYLSTSATALWSGRTASLLFASSLVVYPLVRYYLGVWYRSDMKLWTLQT